MSLDLTEFKSLTSLTLRSVDLSKEGIYNIPPCLESLELTNCHDLNADHIRKLPKSLKNLVLPQGDINDKNTEEKADLLKAIEEKQLEAPDLKIIFK